MDVKKNPGGSGQLQRRVWVSGRVQGVGFRAATAREAARITANDAESELRGFVKNLPDGRVEAVFSGPAETVLALVTWCRKGPPQARVDRLEVKEEAIDPNLPTFGVER